MNNEQKIKLDGVTLNQNNICDLVEKLKDYYSKCSININYCDKTSKNDLNLEEFKKENFNNLRIESIRIGLREDKAFSNCLTISKDWIDGNYELEYSRENYNEFIIIKDIIGKWIKSTEQNKKVITFFNSIISMFIYFILLYVPVVVESVKYLSQKLQTEIIVYSIPLVILISFGLRDFMKFLFPKTEIDIGYNKIKRLRKIFSWIIVVVIIPMILSIIF